MMELQEEGAGLQIFTSVSASLPIPPLHITCCIPAPPRGSLGKTLCVNREEEEGYSELSTKGWSVPACTPFPQVGRKGKVNPLPGPPLKSTWASHSIFRGSQSKTHLSSVFYTPLEEPSQEGITFSHYRETQAGCTHRLQISHLNPSSSSYTSSTGLKANLRTEKGKKPPGLPQGGRGNGVTVSQLWPSGMRGQSSSGRL